MSRRRENRDAKVYVGGLPDDARTDEVESTFRKYGRIRKVWVARRPPGFAFVEFESPRDAEDAVHALDGTRLCGARVTVELSHGRSRRRESSRGRFRSRSRSPHRGGRGQNRERDHSRGDRERSRSRSPARREEDCERTQHSRSRSRTTSPH